MLEVTFSDSTKGALKVAKNYNQNSIGGAIGYIGNKPYKPKSKHVIGKAIGGSSDEVVCIGTSLDMGDIAGELDGAERIAAVREIWGYVEFDVEELERYFTSQREDLKKLIAAAATGAAIRIWRSAAPYVACGFAFVCDVLRDIDCKVSVIDLPRYHQTADQSIEAYSDWAEVAPEKFYQFLPLARELSPEERQAQSDLWRSLKAENASLRAVVNGRLISVPEDFYDHLIYKNIPAQEFVMARLIGHLLGEYQLGVGDGWYALRIKELIAQNKLKIVEDKDPSHPYSKVLKSI